MFWITSILFLIREIDEVHIDEDVKGWSELRVVLEEEGGGRLWRLGGLQLVRVLLLGLLGRRPVLVLRVRCTMPSQKL